MRQRGCDRDELGGPNSSRNDLLESTVEAEGQLMAHCILSCKAATARQDHCPNSFDDWDGQASISGELAATNRRVDCLWAFRRHVGPMWAHLSLHVYLLRADSDHVYGVRLWRRACPRPMVLPDGVLADEVHSFIHLILHGLKYITSEFKSVALLAHCSQSPVQPNGICRARAQRQSFVTSVP